MTVLQLRVGILSIAIYIYDTLISETTLLL